MQKVLVHVKGHSLMRMQKDALLKAIKEQAEGVYEAWHSAVYRRTQQLATARASGSKDYVRCTIKAAHFLELTQKWCAPARHVCGLC